MLKDFRKPIFLLLALAFVTVVSCGKSAHKAPFNRASGTASSETTARGGLSKIADSARGTHCLDLVKALTELRKSQSLLSVYTQDMDMGQLAAAGSKAPSCPVFNAQADGATVGSYFFAGKPDLYEPHVMGPDLVNVPGLSSLVSVVAQDKCATVRFSTGTYNAVCSSPNSIALQNSDGSNEIRVYDMSGTGLTITVYSQVKDLPVCGSSKQNYVS
jgi:hypothetical protein